MAAFTFKGLEEYELKLAKLERSTEKIIGKAVYAGAGIVADAVRKNIGSLPIVSPKNSFGTATTPISGVTAAQKAGLLDGGFGVSRMQLDNGYYHVKLGFDGYNRTKTKKYPSGQPNILIARSVENGTSFRSKQPFVLPAVRSSRKAAEQKMKEILDEEINRLEK